MRNKTNHSYVLNIHLAIYFPVDWINSFIFMFMTEQIIRSRYTSLITYWNIRYIQYFIYAPNSIFGYSSFTLVLTLLYTMNSYPRGHFEFLSELIHFIIYKFSKLSWLSKWTSAYLTWFVLGIVSSDHDGIVSKNDAWLDFTEFNFLLLGSQRR